MLALDAIRLHGGAVRTQQLMGGDRRFETVSVAGRQRAVQVSAVGDHPGLVERRPDLDAVIQLTEHDRRVIRKPMRDVRIEPAAPVIERGRKVPVKERNQGFDGVFQERIDQAVVEVQAHGIHRAASLRQDPAPGDAEAICLHPEMSHQRHVFEIAVIVIACDIAGVSVANPVGRMTEALPNARSRTIGQGRALDLISRGGAAPQKPRRKFYL